MPNPSNPQDFNRFAYVRNNPLRYTDPSGNICVQNGGGMDNEFGIAGNCNGGEKANYKNPFPGGVPAVNKPGKPKSNDGGGDITVSGVPDIVTLTLTPDELIQISDNINEDLAAPDGLIEQANTDANIITAVYTIVSGFVEIALCTTLVACPPAVAVLTIASDFVVNGIANDLTQAQYADLQTVSSYFRDAGNDALGNGSSDLTIVIFNQMDGGLYIAIEGQEDTIIISSGQYYYNYTIIPYIQPFMP